MPHSIAYAIVVLVEQLHAILMALCHIPKLIANDPSLVVDLSEKRTWGMVFRRHCASESRCNQ